MIVLKPVRIDLARPARNVVHCMQTDNTQRVDVSLFVNNRPYDVTADVASGDDLTMAVAYILPNGYGDQYTETALGETAVEQDSSIANLYHVMIDGACTDVAGFVQIIVKFTTDGGQILNSFPLTLDVIKSQPDDVDPGGNAPALSRYLRVDLLPAATEDDTGTVTWDADAKQLKYIPGSGGGGSADVTAAAVKSAIEDMSDAQKGAVKTALGYLTAHQNLPDLGSGYAQSSNVDTTAARTATLSGYKLVTGGTVKVLFTTAVNASNPTLNINSTGAKAIWLRGASIVSGDIVAGDLVTMVYDGTRYRITAFNRVIDLTGYVTTTGLSQALLSYIPKAAQANAENFSSALVISPAGVDNNGAIKSPVAVFGTVTRNGSSPNYSYSADISATVLYPLQQTYPHMRAFLVDHEGRECTLIKPPASDQDSLVFYTLDKTNKKIVYYTVATSGATTVTEDAYNSGGGGGGGISLTVLEAVVDTTTTPVVSLYDGDGNDVGYSDFVAAMAGAVRIVTYYDQQKTTGFEWYLTDQISTSDTITLYAVLPGQGANTLYTAELTESSGLLTGPMYNQAIGTGNASNPTAITVTSTSAANGFSISANKIYTVSDTISGFALTNATPPSIPVGQCIEIRLTVGSTAISSPTWPSGLNFMNGWNGKFRANTYYDIIIDDAGNVFHSERAVSA